jgi:predicted Zn-ribbon and HTH transcriptional regulator
MDFYREIKVVIATKHKKEEVIAPILEKELGVICVTPIGLDTDKLGTFSGEVEREDDPISTLRKKCMMAIEVSGIGVAVANEGSFGGHPTVFFAQADDELVMLIDKENGIEIIERELILDTNFNCAEINSMHELIDFANRIGFPSHGIILKKAKDNYSDIIKENSSIDELIENYNRIKNSVGSAYAETDMRAMYNPTRMKVIAKATERLVIKIKSLCPKCNTPGFGVVETVKGLPCEMCGLPTRSTLKHIYRCQKCNYQIAKEFPFDKRVESPQFCDYCNP